MRGKSTSRVLRLFRVGWFGLRVELLRGRLRVKLLGCRLRMELLHRRMVGRLLGRPELLHRRMISRLCGRMIGWRGRMILLHRRMIRRRGRRVEGRGLRRVDMRLCRMGGLILPLRMQRGRVERGRGWRRVETRAWLARLRMERLRRSTYARSWSMVR
jgi:hypothetical protein